MADTKTRRTWISIVVGLLIVLFIAAVVLVGSAIFYVRRHVKAEFVTTAVGNETFEHERARFAGQEPLIEMRERDMRSAQAMKYMERLLRLPFGTAADPAATPAQAKQIAKLEALTATLAKELAGLEARSTALAAKAGVSAEIIEAIRTGKSTAAFSEPQRVVVTFMQQLSREKKLSDENFAAAQKLLGTRGVVDLTLTCSYYTAINMAQQALKPEMEAGKASTL